MEENKSLLNKISSKYILKKILTIAYGDMNSVLKLTKYNKVLMDKIDINIKKFKDYYQYKIEEKENKSFCFNYFILIKDLIIFILLMVFIILSKINGDEFSHRVGYKEKENFVAIMNDYIFYIFFILIFAFILVNILLIFQKIIVLKAYKKNLSLLFYFLIYFTHYILFLCKFDYARFKDPTLSGLEKIFVYLFSFNILIIIIIIIYILCIAKKNGDDIIIYFLKQIKGINIIKYELPPKFYDLNKKEKYALIFNNKIIEQYNYELNDNQINLIKKINDIRKQYNLSPYKYSQIEKLPGFLINEKTELNLYPEHNIYKLNDHLYIFKYPKNEFQNLLNNNEILNIITNQSLDKIYIIEQNNFEFICPYSYFYIYEKINYTLNKRNNNFQSNKNEIKPEEIQINIPRIRININIPDDDISYTEDKFENKSDCLNMNK